MNLAPTTQTILKAKAERGLSWAKLSEELGATDVWVVVSYDWIELYEYSAR